MSDLRKVKPGDPLRLPAATFNAFIDAAEDYKARQRDAGRGDGQQFRPGAVVLVKNASGADRDRFNVLGISGPIFTPTDNADEFKSRVALAGVTPAAGSHEGRFVILAESIPAGRIGLGYVAGACPVQIDVTDADHAYADVKDADATVLASGASGGAAILWKESGTGTKWAVVRIGVLAGDQRSSLGWPGRSETPGPGLAWTQDEETGDWYLHASPPDFAGGGNPGTVYGSLSTEDDAAYTCPMAIVVADPPLFIACGGCYGNLAGAKLHLHLDPSMEVYGGEWLSQARIHESGWTFDDKDGNTRYVDEYGRLWPSPQIAVYTDKFLGWGVVPCTAGQVEVADDYALFIYR